jgi:hypothetical protein
VWCHGSGDRHCHLACCADARWIACNVRIGCSGLWSCRSSKSDSFVRRIFWRREKLILHTLTTVGWALFECSHLVRNCLLTGPRRSALIKDHSESHLTVMEVLKVRRDFKDDGCWTLISILFLRPQQYTNLHRRHLPCTACYKSRSLCH